MPSWSAFSLYKYLGTNHYDVCHDTEPGKYILAIKDQINS